MYGMIHQALRDMALREITEAEWSDLLRRGGHARPVCIGLEYYSDETTMALMDLVARRLDLPVEEFLQAFGRLWIDFAGASAYGRILDMAGDDFVSFLQSLDRMHSSIRSNMPRADMPSFEVVAADARAIRLRYRSSREGLAPFVQGILAAAAERFDEKVTIRHAPEDGAVRFDILRAGPDD